MLKGCVPEDAQEDIALHSFCHPFKSLMCEPSWYASQDTSEMESVKEMEDMGCQGHKHPICFYKVIRKLSLKVWDHEQSDYITTIPGCFVLKGCPPWEMSIQMKRNGSHLDRSFLWDGLRIYYVMDLIWTAPLYEMAYLFTGRQFYPHKHKMHNREIIGFYNRKKSL